jgi:LAO/AO transport system kinase
VTCSAIENVGIKELWEKIMSYVEFTRVSGYFEERRKQQEIIRMNDTIQDHLTSSFCNNEEVKELLPEIKTLLYEGRITSYKAAVRLLNKYLGKEP